MNFWERRGLKTNLIGAVLLLVVWLLWVPLVLPASFADAMSGSGPMPSWFGSIVYGSLLIATLLVTRFYDRLPAAWAGIGLHRWTVRELGFGTLIGLGMAIIAWGIVAAGGTLRWLGMDDLGAYTLVSLSIIVNAAGEELMFRGYLFQRGIEIFGTTTATLLGAAIFALAHLFNPYLSWLAVVNIFLAGIFFSLCYLQTGSLWLPMAAHATWNLVLAKVLGVTVSGLDFGRSLLVVGDISGPDWLTGGGFGPEGGAAATVALLLGTAALLKIPAITYSPYVHADVFRAFYRRQRTPSP
jgi:membrane protease YdiL (CAAX protease family)